MKINKNFRQFQKYFLLTAFGLNTPLRNKMRKQLGSRNADRHVQEIIHLFLLPISFSIFSSLNTSDSINLVTGIPVHLETTLEISSGPISCFKMGLFFCNLTNLSSCFFSLGNSRIKSNWESVLPVFS